VAYGNEAPPEGAPVPPQELIGAAIFLGLAAVLSISFHGPYLLALVLGRLAFEPLTLGVLGLNAAGFIGTLWLLALRRWAWRLTVAYAGLTAASTGSGASARWSSPSSSWWCLLTFSAKTPASGSTLASTSAAPRPEASSAPGAVPVGLHPSQGLRRQGLADDDRVQFVVAREPRAGPVG
jgi:hypothetical protein